MPPKLHKERINSEIDAAEVRLVDEAGEQAGVMALEDALERSAKAGLDLVEVAPTAVPPVCKIMDFGKYTYQQGKKKKESKKSRKQFQVKEVKFRPGTEEGDYQVKLRNLLKFLENGDHVKVTIFFRGREVVHRELGLKVLERVNEDIVDLAKVEQQPKMEGRQMFMMLVPLKNKPKVAPVATSPRDSESEGKPAQSS